MSKKSHGGGGGGHGGGIDLIPFMNVIVILIPVLMTSAEFAKMAIIDIKLPDGRGSQTNTAQTAPPEEDKSNKLLLTAIVTDSVVTLGAKGGFMPSLFYREYHKYIPKGEDEASAFTVEYKYGAKVLHPKTGREMTIYERYDIFLYVTDEQRNVVQSLYTKYGEMITNAQGSPISTVNANDTVYALTNPRRLIIVKSPDEFILRPLSAYDELKNRLMKVKERYQDADDAKDIIIAAEDQIIYDKIVQIMDAARTADYTNISIAKLRAS
jgi:biopolymer transport protein ExbD